MCNLKQSVANIKTASKMALSARKTMNLKENNPSAAKKKE